MKKAKPTMRHAAPKTETIDPIFAVLDAWRRAATLWDPVDSDELAHQHYEAFSIVIRTRPTTLAGLAALTNWTRLYANSMDIDGEDLCTLVASIADATAALVKKGAVLCGDMSMTELRLPEGCQRRWSCASLRAERWTPSASLRCNHECAQETANTDDRGGDGLAHRRAFKCGNTGGRCSQDAGHSQGKETR